MIQILETRSSQRVEFKRVGAWLFCADMSDDFDRRANSPAGSFFPIGRYWLEGPEGLRVSIGTWFGPHQISYVYFHTDRYCIACYFFGPTDLYVPESQERFLKRTEDGTLMLAEEPSWVEAMTPEDCDLLVRCAADIDVYRALLDEVPKEFEAPDEIGNPYKQGQGRPKFSRATPTMWRPIKDIIFTPPFPRPLQNHTGLDGAERFFGFLRGMIATQAWWPRRKAKKYYPNFLDDLFLANPRYQEK